MARRDLRADFDAVRRPLHDFEATTQRLDPLAQPDEPQSCALARAGRHAHAVITHADTQPAMRRCRAVDADLDGGGVGVSDHVGETFLDDAVSDMLICSPSPSSRPRSSSVQRTPGLRRCHSLTRCRNASGIPARPGDRAQPLHQAARHVVPARHVDDRLRAVHDLQRQCTRWFRIAVASSLIALRH